MTVLFYHPPTSPFSLDLGVFGTHVSFLARMGLENSAWGGEPSALSEPRKAVLLRDLNFGAAREPQIRQLLWNINFSDLIWQDATCGKSA